MSEMGAKAEYYSGNMGIIRGYGMLKCAPLEQRPAKSSTCWAFYVLFERR